MKTKPIARLNLASFKKPTILGNRGRPWRAAWYLVNAFLFRNSIIGLVPSRIKAAILRIFGAKVGRGVVIKPRVDIKYPWFLDIGDDVWIGETVWIDNHTKIQIGSDTCISQGVYIFTGNHNWSDPAFAFSCKPVVIGKSVWVTAFCKVTPGAIIPDQVVVLADDAGRSSRILS